MREKGVIVMRYVIVIVVVVALVMSYYVWGPSSRRSHAGNVAKNVSNGSIEYGNETLASLRGNGLVSLDGTNVRKNLSVNGSLDAKNAHIGQLQVNGKANLNNCIVEGESQINGFLQAEKSTFQAPVTLATHKVKFHDCNINAIVVKKPAWTFGTQVVELANNSICRGPITFEAGTGKIILSGDSQVLGSTHGVDIEKQ